MPRSWFGGTHLDVVIKPFAFGARRLADLAANTVVTFYDAAEDGNKVTDLLLDGNNVASITTDSEGYLPRFQGPDGVLTLWADAGRDRRFLMVTTDGAIDLSTQLSSRIPTSEKGQPGGVAELDAAGRLAQAVDAALIDTGTVPEARFPDRLSDDTLTATFVSVSEPPLNPERYGVEGGGADDTLAFQDAINAVESADGGQMRLPFRPEGYLVSGLVINQDGFQMLGQSFDDRSTTVRPRLIANGPGPVITIQRGRRGLVQDLIVDGDSQASNGFVVEDAAALAFVRSGAVGCTQDGLLITSGTGPLGANGLSLIDTKWYNNGGSGVRARWNTNSGANNMVLSGTNHFAQNGTSASDGAITAGTATLAGSGFADWMQGAPITVIGAGPSGANLMSLIQTVDSSTQVTLTENADTTVSGARWSVGDGLTFAGVSLRGSGFWAAGNENWGVAYGDYVDGSVRTGVGCDIKGSLIEANLINDLGYQNDGGVDDTHGVRCTYWPENSTNQGMALGSGSTSTMILQDSAGQGRFLFLGRNRRGYYFTPSATSGAQIVAYSANDTDADLTLTPQGAGRVRATALQNPEANTAQLNNAGNPVNTSNKWAGKQVFNTATGRWVYASGSAATDEWNYLSDETTAHTPT